MEASWNRWHPRTVRIKQLVDSGVIGKITAIDASFTYDGLDEGNIRTVPELGGGSLYDLGPYSAVAPLWITDFAPVKDIATEVTWHPGGSDETLKATYTIGEVKATILTSMNIPDKITLLITGTEGTISTGGNDAFVSHNNPSTLIIENKDGKTTITKKRINPPNSEQSDIQRKINEIPKTKPKTAFEKLGEDLAKFNAQRAGAALANGRPSVASILAMPNTPNKTYPFKTNAFFSQRVIR